MKTTDELPDVLDSFLQDVAQGIFGESQIDYTDISTFAKVATESDINLLKEIFFSWTSSLTEEDDIVMSELEEIVLKK